MNVYQEKHPLETDSNANNIPKPSTQAPQQKAQQKFENISDELQFYKERVAKCLKLINYQETQIKQMQSKLNLFLIQDGKKYEVLFKFKYDGVIFFFVKLEGSYYFFHEKFFDEEFKKNLMANESIKTFDFQNDIVLRDETMNMMVKQYEDRMNRLNHEMVNSENKFFQANKNYKNALKDIEDYKKTIDDLKVHWHDCIKEVIQSR